MKKIFTLLACILPLTACGANTESFTPEETVKKELPALVKTTVDTYGESECATVVADVKSFQVDVTYGDYVISVPISGKVTFGLRNMYTTDASQLQVGMVFENCNLAANIKINGEEGAEAEEHKYEFKDFSFAAYLSGGNAYIDISNASLMNSLTKYVAELLKQEESVAKALLGSGKYRIDNVITNDKLPLVKKEEVTEENIAKGINDAFGIVTDEDLAKIMSLVHDKGKNTYDLKFSVTDPAIVNRSYSKSGANADVTCEKVNVDVEALTDDKGIFSSVTLKGEVGVKTNVKEESANVNLKGEADLSLDLTKYAITNPSFAEFKSPTVLINFIMNLIKGLFPDTGSNE
ncbi:MAG: hypothetical protein E7178_00685 [Erysipelotrichaceae bacterium]|jgi:hypothetical protein|nr:hypothetical protein [Erysipelotrichaceae bacterium]